MTSKPTEAFLSEFEDRLSSVPRWTIVHTIRKQSVLEHSARVAMLVPRILSRVYGNEKVNAYQMGALLELALYHDQLEAFSGDVASPAKDLLNESKLADRYRFYTNLCDVGDIVDLMPVVKAADLAEACFFIAREISLGNRSVIMLFSRLKQKLRDHLQASNVAWTNGALDLFYEIDQMSEMQVNDLTHVYNPNLDDDEEIPF